MPYIDGKIELCKLQSKTQIVSGLPRLGAWDVLEFVQRRCEGEQGHTVKSKNQFRWQIHWNVQDIMQIATRTNNYILQHYIRTLNLARHQNQFVRQMLFFWCFFIKIMLSLCNGVRIINSYIKSWAAHTSCFWGARGRASLNLERISAGSVPDST
jgi:hypothetical protein